MEELSPTSTKTTCMCKVRIKDWSFLAHGHSLWHYIIVRERAKVFLEVLHFYNSEAKRLPVLMVLAHRAMVFKKLYEQGLKNHAYV